MRFDLKVQCSGRVTYLLETESTMHLPLPACTPARARENGRIPPMRIVLDFAYAHLDSPQLPRCCKTAGSTGHAPSLTSSATGEGFSRCLLHELSLDGIAGPASLGRLSFRQLNASGESGLPAQSLTDLVPIGPTIHLDVISVDAMSMLDGDPPNLSRAEPGAHFAAYHSIVAPDRSGDTNLSE